MRMKIGDWPPLLSHAVAFILGVALVIFTIEEQVIPLKLAPGKMLFATAKAQFPIEWQQGPGIKGIDAQLLRRKRGSVCYDAELSVTVVAISPIPILMTKSQWMPQVYKMISPSSDAVLELLPRADKGISRCATPERVVVDD
jgi:hypothetical protein